MFKKWPIRNKLLVGIGLLLVIVGTLGWSGFYSVYAYRSLVRSLSSRAAELPLAAALSQQVGELRVTVGEVRGWHEVAAAGESKPPLDREAVINEFADKLAHVGRTLDEYRAELTSNGAGDMRIDDSRDEWQTVRQIEEHLATIEASGGEEAWIGDAESVATLDRQLVELQRLAGELPSHLHQRFHELAGRVRLQYRALIVLTWLTSLGVVLMLVVYLRLFYSWVFRPLRVLVKGSRRVAAGEFGFRIVLRTHDEMSELAEAMNEMTARFEAIRDDLDRQVRERTQQVVRSEQLASVGFLAAGVAHEINNPLAAIALCAESLESRVGDLLKVGPTPQDQRQIILNYLRMIQDEAFRCKGITERLLDFSRLGELRRQDTELRELVRDVIDLVKHVGKYHDKRIDLVAGPKIVSAVNPQEIKQVVLNLITNALDSLPSGGLVRLELGTSGDQAELLITDNGCGMTEEVLKHLFEPFFTRRRTGQGIGLGLSITYRIIADHGGHIDAHSDGTDRGSQFRVLLPLAETQKESRHRYQAA